MFYKKIMKKYDNKNNNSLYFSFIYLVMVKFN